MAFTGRRQAALDEIDEDKEANLDPWAKSQLPGEEAATKALDELRLTPNPDGFLCPALVNALDPNDSKNYDAELRRAIDVRPQHVKIEHRRADEVPAVLREGLRGVRQEAHGCVHF